MNPNTRNTLSICVIICLAIASYGLYYLLLRDNVLPFSIHAVSNAANHFMRHYHVLAIGLLPIYIALVIFGTGVLMIYLGSALQRWIARFRRTK